MNIITAYSNQENIDDAIAEIQDKFVGFKPKMILFFASSVYQPNEVAEKMQSAFRNTLTVGCTTAGEIVTGKMLENSIVAMAFNSEALPACKAIVLKNIKTTNPVAKGFEVFEDYFSEKMMDMDPRKYVGLILIDGMSGAEEKIMERIGDLTDVIFVGASAGDDLKFEKTYVYANGKAHTDSALLMLLKPAAGFDFIKTQSFNTLNTTLTATEVEEENRAVIQFNGRPALEAYADAIQKNKDEAKNSFMKHPLGLMDGDEPFVRSPQKADESKMVFYCNVKKGMELTILDAKNIVDDTRQVLQDKFSEIGSAQALINFHCILRTLELKEKGQMDAYGDLFTDIPAIGFSTYGEEFIGHINQTSTMLILK